MVAVSRGAAADDGSVAVGRRRRHRPARRSPPRSRACDAAYYLVHSLGSRDFAERDLEGARTRADEAERAGLRQIVYLGGLGDDEADLSEHLRSRRETAEALQRGAVPVTTLRAAMVVGAGSAAFETILALVDRLPGMVMPALGVDARRSRSRSPTSSATWRACCGREEALGQAYRRRRAGGHDLPRDDRAHRARSAGKRPLLIEVPVLTPRLSSYWLHLVTPVKRRRRAPAGRGAAQRRSRARTRSASSCRSS